LVRPWLPGDEPHPAGDQDGSLARTAAAATGTVPATTRGPRQRRPRPPDRPMWPCPRCARSFANRNRPRPARLPGRSTTTSRHRTPGPRHCRPDPAGGRGARPGHRAAREDPDRGPRPDELRRLHPAPALARRSRGAGPPADSARFRYIQVFSPRNVPHTFRLAGPVEVDAESAAGSPRPTWSASSAT